MKLKTELVNGTAYAVLTAEGLPIYVHDDGKEVGFDAPAAATKISALNGEARGHREAKEAAEKALKGFEGISDPAAALKALETIANIDAGQLVQAGKVEEIKAAAVKAAEAQVEAAQKAAREQIASITGERDTLKTQLDGAVIGGAFKGSLFVKDKVAVPPHMLQNTYGANFKVEGGKAVPYDAAGNKLFSRVNPGEVADFDEAIELLVSADPYKDHILRGAGQQGSGAQQGQGGGGGKTLPRSQFEKLPPADQAAKMKDGFTLTEG